jgi:Zn-finger nucleic acid-binding protein
MMVKINKATKTSRICCPFCDSPMKQFQLPEPAMNLDACKHCVTVWFVAGEFEKLPEGADESQDELRLRGAEAHGKLKLKGLAEKEKQEMAENNSRNIPWSPPW